MKTPFDFFLIIAREKCHGKKENAFFDFFSYIVYRRSPLG